MSATTIVASPSTSLILIRNVSSPTLVYLSSFASPSFSLTIRDTTGSPNIQTNVVRLSTIGNSQFIDGTTSYLLNKPFSLVNVAFRNPYWQILHTSGQVPTESAANVGILHASTMNAMFVSSAVKYVSTLDVGNILTPNSFDIQCPFTITNLSTSGVIEVQSTLQVFGDVYLKKNLFVSGPTLGGSLSVSHLLPVSSPSYVLSSIGVGQGLFVEGTTSVLGTLTTLSTNQIQTLQVQASTFNSVLDAKTLQVQDVVSSLGGLRVINQFTTLGLLELAQNVSSLGAFSTQLLNVRDYASARAGISTFGNGLFYSDFNLASSLVLQNDSLISTGLYVKDNAYVSSISTTSISTLQSFSTQVLTLTSTAYLSTGLSTQILQGLGWISIGSYFFTPGIISSIGITKATGSLLPEGPGLLGSVHLSSSAGIGDHLDVRGNSYLGALSLVGSLSTSSNVTTTGFTEIMENVGVRESVFVDSNVFIQDGSQISSFFVNSFLLSNLHILTSSPFLDFTASTLRASTIETLYTQIGITNPPNLTRSNTRAITAQSVYARAENILVETLETSNVLWGDKQTSLNLNSKPQFIVNTEANFPQGLSSQNIRANIFTTKTLEASFLGNGAGISNVAVPYAVLSSINTFASTISTTFLFTSSFQASTFIDSLILQLASSFQSPTLRIDGPGFPLYSSVNQMLSYSSTSMVVNRVLYIDAITNNVGIRVSSPSYTLDVDGQIFASNFYFSSFTPVYASTQGTAVYSSIYTSSTTIRDALRFATNGIQLQTNTTPFDIQVIDDSSYNTKTDLLGIYSLHSSIALSRGVQIYNPTQSVFVNATSNTNTYYPLVVSDTLVSCNGYFSSVVVTNAVQSITLDSPSLYLNQTKPFPTNSISSSAATLYFNTNLMTLQNLTSPSLGIKMASPGATLNVNGNAYFSSLTMSGNLLANFLTLGSQIL